MIFLKERWADHGRVMVSDYGRIWSWPKIKRCCGLVNSNHRRVYLGGILKGNISPSGYKRVNYSGQAELVHRLVGFYFVDGYSEDLTINHIDGDKLNNHYSNLEWVTNEENLKHAHRTGLMDYKVPVRCVETGVVYDSLHDAARSMEMAVGNLCSHLKGRQKSFGGKRWEYLGRQF